MAGRRTVLDTLLLMALFIVVGYLCYMAGRYFAFQDVRVWLDNKNYQKLKKHIGDSIWTR